MSVNRYEHFRIKCNFSSHFVYSDLKSLIFYRDYKSAIKWHFKKIVKILICSIKNILMFNSVFVFFLT